MENTVLMSISVDELIKRISNAFQTEISKLKPEEPKPEEELIKVPDVANLFGVSTTTIHSWKNQGILPFYRISDKIYFKKNECLEYLKKVNGGSNG